MVQRRKHPNAKARPRLDAKEEEKASPRKISQPKAVPSPEAVAHPADSRFPIVGIGASAGGLEALEQFFHHVPPGSGMAFVVVQHLDPDHKGAMVELLQRATSMPVMQVKDRLPVERDHVYIIPPNKDMGILRGVLHLTQPIPARGLRLPIDFFFRSLADDQQERGIGVVLSGMGSDGTLGLRAIKEKAGASFVQALSSAKFDGMPRSAVDAGLADVVAPVEELPSKIIAYTKHAPHLGQVEITEEKAQSALEKVFIVLRTHTGNDFSCYKRSTIYRRIERRMGLHQIDRLARYVTFLRENPKEIEQLFKELLIGVTSFFRDPAAWEHLGREVLPKLLAERPAGSVLRAWVPGCSTGEEAYSLAITFLETLDRLKPAKNLSLQIFATDLDRDAIEKARSGLYPANIAADVSPERLRRFFIQHEHGYRVGKTAREMAIFAPQNIIMDPPFTKLDILSCRNLLIYLSGDLQKRLIPLFHYALNPGGILFLGSAETVGSHSSLFVALDGKTRIHRRLDAPTPGHQIDFPASSSGATAPQAPLPASPPPPPVLNLQALAERVLVQRFSPAAVLTTDKGDILYFGGRTGKYLEPAVGRASLNIFSMAREGLRHELSATFNAAMREGRTATARGVRVRTNGASQVINLTVERLVQPEALRGAMMVVFTDVETPERRSKVKERSRSPGQIRVADLETQLQHALEEAQGIREEMQTSQEELKSANEELQSTNEELQSSNEELTTSKEEMQSLNEELQTVNQELQAKVDELSRSNNDMKNLLNSTDIATLFLDDNLHVRRFTTETTKIIKLIPGDAGRPITDITTQLNYAALVDDAREVLRTLVFKETVVSARNNQWFSVRIMPYRTLENMIDGVVITFTDVSVAKRLEATLRDQANQLRQMADAMPILAWAARPDGTWDLLSRQWIEYTGVAETEQIGFGWLEQMHPDDRGRVRESWKEAIRTERAFDLELRLRSKHGQYRWFKARAVPIRDEQGTVLKWYGSCTDIQDLGQAERVVRASGDSGADEEEQEHS